METELGKAHRQDAQVGAGRFPARYGLLPAVLLLAACAGAPAEREGPPPGEEPDAIVGLLDDGPVTFAEVALHLRSRDPEQFARAVEGTVLERATRAEATRVGADIPQVDLARETTRRYRAWEQRLRETARRQGREADPAAWLKRVAGLTPAQFRTMLERHTRVEMLQDRLLRFEQETSPCVEVSVIVLGAEETARRVAERARGGDDFSALARQDSRHASAAQGGRLAFPLLEEDFPEPEIAAALFSALPGEIVGPFATRAEGVPFFSLYRLEKRRDPRPLAYREVERDVLQSLQTRPVDVGEYERWRRRVLLRHGYRAAPPPGE